jgi:uncharacterized protein YjdB
VHLAAPACGDSTGPTTENPVATVSISPPSPFVVVVGGTLELEAIIRDDEGRPVEGQTVHWSSRDEQIASVSPTGVLTGRAPGTTEIAASVAGRSASASVTVSPKAVAEVRLSPDAPAIEMGGTVQLSATAFDVAGDLLPNRPIAWSSTNEQVATVSSGGLVTGVGPGTATIRATSEGKTGSVTVTVQLAPVASVVVTPPTATILPSGTVQLQATPTDARGNTLSGRAIAWSSSDESVARVSASGLVTAVTPGVATITATSEGRSGSAVITVGRVSVASVDVSPAQASVLAGSTVQLSATPRDASGTPLPDRTVVWASSDNSIAPVSQQGVVTGIRPGTVTITASSEGHSGSSTVTVTLVPVASVSVAPPTLDLPVGGTGQLTATARDASGNVLPGRQATWSSDNPGVAEVSQTGAVTGRGEGRATITATSEGHSATATVTVRPASVASVAVSPPSSTLFPGGTVQLTATTRDAQGNTLTGRSVIWSSTNGAVASVSSTGAVTALAPGNATIIATSEGRSGSASITVNPAPVASVAVSQPPPSIVVGTTVQLSAVPQDAAGGALDRPVTWSSSNPGIATVTSTGLVRGVAPGTSTITATSEGKSGTATVTVAPPPVASVSVNPSTETLVPNETLQLTATLRDADNNLLSGRAVAWSSSNDQIARVSASGLVTAVSQGTVTITATSEGRSGTASIAVDPPPVATVGVTPSSLDLIVGASEQLTATPRDAAGNTLSGRAVTWSSNRPEVAEVSQNGTVTARGAGTATITATSEGKSGTATVRVQPAPVASVDVAPTSAALTPGGTVQLTATPKDARGNVLTGRTVTWRSSNPGVATVTSAGLVTGVAPGNASIIATSEGKEGTAAITVNPTAVASVTVSPSELVLLVGDEDGFTATARDASGRVLTGRPVSWSTTNGAVVTVTQEGRVKATGPGEATISATVGGVSGGAKITVYTQVPVASVTVEPPSASLVEGDTRQLTATLRDAWNQVITGRPITWRSSNDAIAQVSAAGVVTAMAPGSATIFAESEGVQGSASITVNPAVATVEVVPASVELEEDEEVTLTATARDARGAPLTGRTVSWSSVPGSVASVTSAGRVRARREGTATITATIDGKTGTATIVVVD